MNVLIVAVVAATLDVSVVDELVPLYPDRAGIELQEFRLDVPRGATAGVHVVVGDISGSVSLRLDGGQSLPHRWYRLHDVPVEENTGLGSRTERFKGDVNPHVIRRAPFRVYEAMEPLVFPVDGGGAFRLELDCAAGVKPGTHAMAIDVLAGDDIERIPLTVVVHEAIVPPPGRDTLGYTNWFSPSNVATYHDVQLWSEPHWAMMRQYADMMAKGRQNMFWVKWPDFFDQQDGEWVLNADRLVRYVNIFTDAGLYWIEGAPMAGRPGGDWGSQILQLKLGMVPMTTAPGRAIFANQCSQLKALIDANGWSDRWVQHIADEPTDANAADYAVAASMMREHLSGVPIFEATMSRSLVGAVDMWCPQVQAWQANQDFFDGRKAAGDRVWVYTCLRPGGPWLNRLLDQERLRQVYFGWGAAKNGWDGYLHWGLNHWKADPFEQSVVDHPDMPKSDNRLPAGDTHVLYPGTDGPWSGLRFEAHRIGMEDHAMLIQLADRNQQKAMEVIDKIFRSADDYEIDVAAYRALRRLLMELLDENFGPRKIEILGFPGCPMTPIMNERVRAAAFRSAAIESIDLSKLPADDELLRWPSPTVLVDGVDLFGIAPAATPAMACRIYPAGVPAVEAIRAALEGL
jgi:hypothetical protein